MLNCLPENSDKKGLGGKETSVNTFAMDFHAKPDWEADAGCLFNPYRGWMCHRMEGGFIYIKFLLLVQKAGKFNTTAFPASWPLSNLLG